MAITKCTGTVNTTYKAKRSIKYIVLHYTAGTSSKAGTAASTAKYFASGKAGGSADFIVDDGTIVQYNGDIANRYCGAVGGSKYSAMSTKQGGKYYNVCTNWNSISIEMCSCKTNTKSLLASDTDWYLTDKTVANAVELTKYLMKLYNVPVKNVIMHHHVTGKVCPNPWCVNESRLSGWNSFKARLSGTVTTTTKTEEDDEMVETIKVNINGKEYNAARILKNGKNYIAISDLEQAGFDIGYNADTKTPSITNATKELKILVDDKETSVEAVNINGNNYVPIRSVASATGKFDVVYENGTVTVKTK